MVLNSPRVQDPLQDEGRATARQCPVDLVGFNQSPRPFLLHMVAANCGSANPFRFGRQPFSAVRTRLKSKVGATARPLSLSAAAVSSVRELHAGLGTTTGGV